MAEACATSKEEKAHFAAIIDLGCIACRHIGFMDTPCEIHHIRDGQGMGRRASVFECLGLCPPHHRTGGHGVAFHAGPEVWQQKFGTERELLAETLQLIGMP